MEKTKILYRCESTEWAKLPYEDALKYRILKAKDAMNHYRLISREIVLKKKVQDYDENIHKYLMSEKAMNFNKKLLFEIEEDEKKWNLKDVKYATENLEYAKQTTKSIVTKQQEIVGT